MLEERAATRYRFPFMKVSDLRGILTYIPGFREKTFVIALDGAVIADDNFPNLLLDIAVLRSLSIRIVIVHGAAHQLQELSAAADIPLSNADGTGITDAETLKLALTAANRITHEVLEGLASSDLRAAYTNAIIAHPYGIVGGVDRLYTGRVERVDTEFLQQLLDKGVIPVIAPLGFDGDGRTFRVNSDGVAMEVAEALKAAKLIYVANHAVFRKPAREVNQISVLDAEEFYKKHKADIAENSRSKFEHSIRACRAGVNRVHIIDGRVDEALLTEIFSNEGIGTMVYANEYQAVRRALKKDVRAIHTLIRESVEQEELVKRTRQEILSPRRRLLCVPDRRHHRRLRRPASPARRGDGRAGLPLRQQCARKPGHRPETDAFRRKRRPGKGGKEHLSSLHPGL